jgi:hypothetical protein
MSLLLRSVTVIALCSAAALLSLPGCSQQGEGERCDSAKNANADCDSGLVCVLKSELRDPATDRCCPADLSSTDPRCDRKTGSEGTGGSGGTSSGTGGTGGSNPSGGENAAGSSEVGGGGAPSSSAGAPSSSAGAPSSSAGAPSGDTAGGPASQAGASSGDAG